MDACLFYVSLFFNILLERNESQRVSVCLCVCAPVYWAVSACALIIIIIIIIIIIMIFIIILFLSPTCFKLNVNRRNIL